MPTLFNLAGHDAELVALESTYGRVLVSGAFFAIAARGLHHFFFGLHRPKVVFVAALTGNITNIVLNFILIFGMFGFPELGLLGAAIGTVVGSMCELAVPMFVFLGRRLNDELGTRAAWKPHWRTISQLWRIGWPKAMTWVNELACWTYFMTVLLAKFGDASLASGWIVLRYMHLSFMPAVGISTAIAAVVGRYIGAGKPDVANHRAWLGVKIGMGYMGICALLFLIFRRPMITAFVETDDAVLAAEIVRLGMVVLICAAVFQLFDALAITLSGALSGAGDTLWPGVVMFITVWTCIIGLGTALVEYWPELGPLGPWIGAAAYIIVLGIAYWYRWIGGKWRDIKLVDHA
jgi:MATE family multidrug resistance protein